MDCRISTKNNPCYIYGKCEDRHKFCCQVSLKEVHKCVMSIPQAIKADFPGLSGWSGSTVRSLRIVQETKGR